MPDLESHTDTSSLRPYVRPIKELPDPTIASPNMPINLGRSNPTTTSMPENPDMRESLRPFPTGGTSISTVNNARKTAIGLSVGIIVALILMGIAIYLMVLKYRRTKKDEEAAKAGDAGASENGWRGDLDVVSPAPPRYSLENPAMGEVVLPPAYLEAGKSDEEQEGKPQKNSETSAVGEKMGMKVERNGSLKASPVRNMRILI
ncbi:uncharacterized protein DFL_009745 [Arthrobotrys flagrans]|uniref:Uncharacterized protein n=1 Tax=Arthrobotrys flagrans TaxID=97331 RepID=A0A436ZSP8_ARTFL|nr:hypothetical protein DFL_009745 [Arthrobotrys flagrans]